MIKSTAVHPEVIYSNDPYIRFGGLEVVCLIRGVHRRAFRFRSRFSPVVWCVRTFGPLTSGCQIYGAWVVTKSTPSMFKDDSSGF